MTDYRFHARELAWQLESLEQRIYRLESQMTSAVTQADLDALTTALTADDAAIQTEIDALKAANPSLDLTGLQQAVANTAALVPAVAAPPVDTTPPADGTTTPVDAPVTTDGTTPAA